MTQLTDIWPVLGLTLTTPRLQLRPVADDHIPAMVDAVLSGIHDPDASPFSFPWTDAPREELPRNTAAHVWHQRAKTTAGSWSLLFGVWQGNDFAGCQELLATSFAETRTVSTGSWLKQSAQGQGLGTEMRTAVVLYAFDFLSAEVAESEAFDFNTASLGVSRSLGYEPNGVWRHSSGRDHVRTMQRMRLTPELFRRPDWSLKTAGHLAAARFLGIEDA
jgi:RimJ/RimL family protein N-acetyltransferase